MKIALLGYGKMGKQIEEIAIAKGHEIVCRISSEKQNWNDLLHADVAIDFSHADSVFTHLERCAHYKKELVIGTTGWADRIEEAKIFAEKNGMGVLYAPNFSIGVQLYIKILEYGASLFRHFKEYDVAGLELHHRQKKDAPSGTAKEIARRLREIMDREVGMSYVRVGSMPGEYQLYLDSPSDTITLSHQAHSREGYARGAVDAAEWLRGKKGFYTLDDLIKGVCHES